MLAGLEWRVYIDCSLGALAAQNDTLSTTLAERDVSIRQQQDTMEKYESKLQEAKTVLSDKEQLEENAMKQLEVINRQAEELASLKESLAERDAALAASQNENAALQLKASTTKQHCIFFDEPWIVETTYHKLRGTVPSDREGHYLLALQGLILIIVENGSASDLYSAFPVLSFSERLGQPEPNQCHLSGCWYKEQLRLGNRDHQPENILQASWCWLEDRGKGRVQRKRCATWICSR